MSKVGSIFPLREHAGSTRQRAVNHRLRRGARLPGVLDLTRADITKASCHKDLQLNVAVKHFCINARMSCISTYRPGWSLPRCFSGFNLWRHCCSHQSGWRGTDA